MFEKYSIILILLVAPLLFGANRWWAIYPIEILVFLVASKMTLHKNLKISAFLPNNVRIPLAGLFVLIIISAIHSSNLDASLHFIFLFTAIILCLYIGLSTGPDRNMRLMFAWVMIFSSCIQPIIVCFQKMEMLSYDHWIPSNFIAGTFSNHNHFAGLFNITLPLSIALIFYLKDKKKLLLLTILIQLTGLLWSQSRGAWFAFFVSISFMLLKAFSHKNKKTYIISFLTFLLLMLLSFKFFGNSPIATRLQTCFFPLEDKSALMRFRIWEATILIIKDHFLLGTGPGTFSQVAVLYRPEKMHAFINHAHNDYLEWICETGIFSLPLFIALLIALIKRGLRISVSEDPFPLAAASATLSTAIHSLTDYNMRIPALAIYLAFLIGLSFANCPKSNIHS